MRYLLIAAVVLLAGCAGPRLEGAGPRGGIVTFVGSNETEAFKVAEDHCQKGGRHARISQMKAIGAQATFDCVE